MQVLTESRKQVWEAFQIVMDIKDGWPEALRGIKTSQLAREILNDKEAYIEEMKASGQPLWLGKKLRRWDSIRV